MWAFLSQSQYWVSFQIEDDLGGIKGATNQNDLSQYFNRLDENLRMLNGNTSRRAAVRWLSLLFCVHFMYLFF